MKGTTMNMYTHEIANALKVNIEVALKVQQYLECTDFDFSESSASKLKRHAKQALKDI